jgi:hypothetical protein
MSVPQEVEAIATFWAGVEPRITESGPNTWLFRSRDDEDGFIYRVTKPGSPLALREDNGRPFTGEPSTDWVVVCINDAPDAWWTVSAEGVYQPWSGSAVTLW